MTDSQTTFVELNDNPSPPDPEKLKHKPDPEPLPISEDPDRDGQPGVQSWQFVALMLGGLALIVGAVLALLLTGTVTWGPASRPKKWS